MTLQAIVADLQKKTTELPYDKRRQKAIETFDVELADDDFFQLPYEEQDRIREKFVGMVAPVKEMVAGPEDRATGEAYQREMKPVSQPATAGQGIQSRDSDADEWDALDTPERQPTGGFIGTAGKDTIEEAGRVADSWTKGSAQNEIGILRARQLMGEDTPEIREKIARIKKTMPPEYKGDRGLFEQALSATAEMAPIMIEGMEKGFERGAILGTGMAAVAGVAGAAATAPAAGAGALVTAPAAFGMGYSVGQVSGTIEHIGKIEAGLAYDELLDIKDANGNRIDPAIAKGAAAAVGIVNGAIEMGQIALLLKTIPGADKLISGAIRRGIVNAVRDKTLKNVALKAAGRYAGVVTAETGQEVLQETTNILATYAAAEISGLDAIPELERQQIQSRLLDTVKQSALAFGTMALPGSVVRTAIDAKGVLLEQGEEAETAESLLGVQTEPLSSPDIKTVPPGTFEKQAAQQSGLQSPDIATLDATESLDAEEAAAGFDEEQLAATAGTAPDVAPAIAPEVKEAAPTLPQPTVKENLTPQQPAPKKSKYADLSREDLTARVQNLLDAKAAKRLSTKQEKNLEALKAELTARGITPADESAAVFEADLQTKQTQAQQQGQKKALDSLVPQQTGKSAQQSAQDMAVEQELLNNRIQRERVPQAKKIAAENPELVSTIANLDKAPSPEKAVQAVSKAKRDMVAKEVGGALEEAPAERLNQAKLVFRQQRRKDLETIIEDELNVRKSIAELQRAAKTPAADKSGAKTLGGAIRAMGGINPSNLKKDLLYTRNDASKAGLFKSNGIEMETAQRALEREGWLLPSEKLSEMLASDPEQLKRGHLATDAPQTKHQKEQAAKFEESATDPDEMPPDYDQQGAYQRVLAGDLPEGAKLGLVIDGRYDSYTVVSNDVFGDGIVVRGTGSQFTLEPAKAVEVRKADLGDQTLPDIESDVTAQDDRRSAKRGEDRRVNAELRAEYDAMSDDERFKALYEDPLTGLGNRRAYNKSPRLPVQVSIDADGLKWVNDTFGHQAGDAFIKHIAEGLKQTGLKAYHPSGDEYWAEADTGVDVDAEIGKARTYLKDNPIIATRPDGSQVSFTGAFSYGKGTSQQEAEQALASDKAQRELSGERQPRGAEPKGVLGQGAKGDQAGDRGKTDSGKEIADQVHDYSSTQINLPEAEANEVRDFAAKIPDSEIYTAPDDTYGREAEPHVTVRYGMDTIDPAEIAPALEGMGPITAKMGKVSIFETDKYDVVKVEVDSPELREANKRVGDTVDLPGETYKDYQPHATIAYVKKGEGKKYVGDKSFEGKEITINEVVLSAKDGKMHPIKLQGQSKKPAEPTKREKAQASYRTYIDSLSDDQRALVTDLIQDDPKHPGLLEMQIKKAVSARSKKQTDNLHPEGWTRIPGSGGFKSPYGNYLISGEPGQYRLSDEDNGQVVGGTYTDPISAANRAQEHWGKVKNYGGKKKLTFEEFEKAYTDAFNNSMKYRPDQAGSGHYMEKMAELAEEYPEWAEQVENKKQEPEAGDLTPQSKQALQRLRDHLENKGSGWIQSPTNASEQISYRIVPNRSDGYYDVERINEKGIRTTLSGDWNMSQARAEALKDARFTLTDFSGKPSTITEDSAPAAKIANWVVKQLEQKKPFEWRQLFEASNYAYGGTQSQGKYTPKDAYDAMEMGVNQFLADQISISVNADLKQAEQTVLNLKKMLSWIPTQTKRTEEQQQFQQFSTPPSLSYVANWVAKLDANDVYLEPSAGIGGLAIFAKDTVAKVHVNELSPRRAALLKELGFENITTENAEQLNNILPEAIKPTVIVMNPPFSSTAGRVEKNKTKYGAQHVEQALARLEPGGRLVAIVGRGMADDRATFHDWWQRIKKKYNVRANIGISGEEYRKYGTSFDNQILVIDKTGPSGHNIVKGFVDRIEDLPTLLKGVRDERQSPSLKASQRPASESVRSDADQSARRPSEQQRDPLDTPAAPEPGKQPAESERGPGRGPAESDRPADLQPAEGGRPARTGKPDQSAPASPDRRVDGESQRPGSAAPDLNLDDLSALIDSVGAEEGLIDAKPSIKTAATKAASGTKKGLEAVADLIKAINNAGEVSNKGNLPPLLHPEVYAQARTHLLESYTDFVAAGKEVKEWVRHALQSLSKMGANFDIAKSWIMHFYAVDRPKPAEEVSVENEDQRKNKGELTDSIFETYQPKIKIAGSRPHPTPLVESAAMADTEAPDVTYAPSLPKKVIEGFGPKDGRGLSDIQLEAVVYAGQAHTKKLPNGARKGFFVGDGCVAAGTRIYNPITGEHVPIEALVERGEEHIVLSLTEHGFKPHKANCPFEKGVADLYEVVLEDGRKVTVTDEHKFLTPFGWMRICDGLHEGHFLACAEGHPAYSLGFSRSTQHEDDQRWLRKPQDCLDRYCLSRRPYDGQPRCLQDTGQALPPLQDDVHGHTRALSQKDAQEPSQERIHLRQSTCPPSKRNFSPLVSLDLFSTEHQASVASVLPSKLTRPMRLPFAQEKALHHRSFGSACPDLPEREGDLSHYETAPRCHSVSENETRSEELRHTSQQYQPLKSLLNNHQQQDLCQQQGCSCAALTLSTSVCFKDEMFNSRWNRITSIRFVEKAPYYDMYVPGPQNYVAEGIVHHNTGVGKGREISGIIRDNWEKGRRKAVWVSESWDLAKDAERDLKDSGWDEGPGHLFTQKGLRLGAQIEGKQGILFTTYSTVRGGFANYREDEPVTHTDLNIRLNQIVDWLGPDFDGVIAFDEAHNMANAAAKKGDRGTKPPSQMALAGIALQQRLPDARVVYVSATGATEVENLVYAERLGLWGESTPFTNASEFVNEVSSGGIATMELIARNMKSLGLYLARSLSYEQVHYDRLTHTLDKSQRAKYNELARAWQVVLQNIGEAIKITEGNAASAKLSSFWGAHQRFFNQIITTMQMPSAIKDIKKAMDDGHAIVLQLVNTDEAQQERALGRRTEGQELEDLDMTPRENLISYLENGFPVQQFEEYTDENGNIRKRPVYDSNGNPVINREAADLRDQMIARVSSIVMPNGPLDFLIQELGHENIAEVTGRSRRIVTNTRTGKQELEKRSSTIVQADVDDFLNDKKQVLVFSGKGATGRSFHADKRYKNQRPRRHYLIQPGWRADKAVQGLGRTHRSNQISAPDFILVTTDLKGQARFLSSIARRLDQLGALTKGERKTGSQGIFQARDNLESEYAKEALSRYIHSVVHGDAKVSMEDFEAQTGLKLLSDTTGIEVPPIVKFLNRLLSMEIETQNAVFDEFSAHTDAVVQEYADAGNLDVGIETITGESVKKVDEQVVFTDEETGAKTKYVQIDVTNPSSILNYDQAVERFLDPSGVYRNVSSGRVWMASGLRQRTDSSGNAIRYRALISPQNTNQTKPVTELESDKWEKLSAKEAKKVWTSEYEALPKKTTTRRHLITGNILPVWNRLKGTATVYRMQTDDGQRYLGRAIHSDDLQETLQSLDIAAGKIEVSPDEIRDRILNQGATVRLADRWVIKRSLVSGEERIELTGPDYDHYRWVQGSGLIIENIQYRNRYFVPANGKSDAIIQKIIDLKPIITIDSRSSERLTPTFSRSRQKPKKTVLAYNMFRTKKSRPGEIFPLFIGKDKPTPIGQWLEAEYLPTKGYAERPGWHSGTMPQAPHLMKKDGTMPTDRVWAEVEIPADIDWQAEADKSPTKDIRERVPKGGFYRFKRPGNQGLEWRISGAIKVNRILTDEEVEQINKTGNPSILYQKSEAKVPSSRQLTQKGEYGKPTQATEQLIRTIEKHQGRKLPDAAITEAPQDAVSDRARAFAQRLAKSYTKKVIFVFNHRPDMVDFDGVTIGNDTIYLNALADLPHKIIVGHELLHELRRDHEDIYAKLLDSLWAQLQNVDEYRARMDALTQREGVKLSDNRLYEELIADFIGDQMSDKAFWNTIAQRQPSVFERIIETVKRFLTKMINRIQTTPALTSPYFKDIKAARQAAIDAFAEYGKRQKALQVAGKNSDARFMAAPKADRWYSQLRNVIAQKMTNGPAEQIKQAVQSWANKGEYKAEELEWSGLNEYLDSQSGKVTKQQVLDYLDANHVQVQEVEKKNFKRDENVNVPELRKQLFDSELMSEDEMSSMSDEEVIELANDQGFFTDDTKFSQYQLPGGENYKELLLTLPEDKRQQEVRTAIFSRSGGFLGYLEAEQPEVIGNEKLYNTAVNLWEKTGHTLKKEMTHVGPDNNYRSSHFEEPNILAHVRFNERTGPNGERVLFIEEVQSDWHQAGRKKGYGKSATPYGWGATGQAGSGESVPNAPFKKTWPMLAMRRMVRYAAENGFDSIAWTPGEVQAERYDLSKQLDTIEGEKIASKHVNLRGFKDGKEVLATTVEISKLDDHVGKDVADKIRSQLNESDDYSLSGLDLKVGDKGMAGFYDKILPAEVNKFFGKAAWGSAKVGKTDVVRPPITETGYYSRPSEDPAFRWEIVDAETDQVVDQLSENEPPEEYANIATPEKRHTVWTLPITPQMRQKALREGMPLFSRRNTKKIDHANVLPGTVKERIKKARGLPIVRMWQRIVDSAREIGRQRAHFPSLQKIADVDLRAKLNDLMRLHQEIPETVKLRAIQMIHGLTKDLSSDGFEVYRMNIILADMARDINKGLSVDGRLPFGFETTDEVLSAKEQYHRIADENPEVAEALARRNEMINNIKNRLVKAKLLKREVLEDEDYFHHQVLQYWEGKYGLGVGSADVRTKFRPWMAARKGSALDYNTEYVEAEFMAVSQQLAQLETVETLRRVKQEADVYADLKQQAKAQNKTNFWNKLRDEGRLDVNPLTGEETNKEMQKIKAMIAWSNEGLGKLAADGKLEYDSEWDDFVDELAVAYRTRAAVSRTLSDAGSFGFDHPRWFHFLSYLLDRQKPGANYAATIFKAIRARDNFIKTELGDAFLTFKDMIPEGYTIWKPEPGKGWFWASTVTESMINKMVAGEMDPKDIEFRKVLARGRELIWVIPQGLAETMDKFYEVSDPSFIGKFADWAQSAWKQYILLNPYSVVRYNINNMSGDLDICLAYAPEIASKKYAHNAAVDLLKWSRNKDLPAQVQAELDHARRLGVIGSGFSVQEVDDVLKIMPMGDFVQHTILQEPLRKLSPKAWAEGYWQFVQKTTGYRENVLRLAAYRYFRDNSDKSLYGASSPVEVNAIADPKERAAKLARELIGDYGNISKTGQWLRKRLLPFYSWLEINTPRYVYMMRNSKYENRNAGSVGSRVAAVAGKKAVMSAGKLALRANMLYGLVTLWNLLFFYDEEEELGESGRRQLHIILGRREDGSIISMRFQGAWSDVLSWFALEDWPQDMLDVFKDGMTIGEKLQVATKEAGKALLNRGANMLRPDVKMFGEAASGYSFYPDITRPIPIRDRVEHVLRTFKLDKIYTAAMGRPERGQKPGSSPTDRAMRHLVNDLKTMLVYESNPGEIAYYDARAMVFDWLSEQGTEKRFGGRPNKKGNALYWYKQAMKFGDLDAAHRYLTKYYELGGSPRDKIEAIKRAHPLSSIPKKDRYAFRQSLRPDQDKVLSMALEWYRSTYYGKDITNEND